MTLREGTFLRRDSTVFELCSRDDPERGKFISFRCDSIGFELCSIEDLEEGN